MGGRALSEMVKKPPAFDQAAGDSGNEDDGAEGDGEHDSDAWQAWLSRRPKERDSQIFDTRRESPQYSTTVWYICSNFGCIYYSEII